MNGECTCPVLDGVQATGSSCPVHGFDTVSWRKMNHDRQMRIYGYQQIKSDAQAAQLIRREVKGMAAEQQRYPHALWGFEWLLKIKKGAWYRFSVVHYTKRKRLNVIEEKG